MRTRNWILALAATLALLLPSLASATPVQFDVISGSESGYGYSWVHSARNSMTVDGVDYYPGGRKLLGLDGFIDGDITGNTITLGASSLTAMGVGGGFSGNWSLDIVSGVLTVGVDNVVSGTIDYALRRPDATLYETGTIYVAGEAFMNFPTTPNTYVGNTLTLWANNWDNANVTRQEHIDAGGSALGFDIRAISQPIPEPGAALLFGVGLVVMGAQRRFRR